MKLSLLLPPALSLALCACGAGAGASSSSASDPSCGGAAAYAARGPFEAGVTTLDVDGVPTEVWYPVDRGAEAGRAKASYDMREWLPADARAKIPDADDPPYVTDAYRDAPASAKQRFPLVLFSHGLGGFRVQSSFLMTHLASWGFVVAAPDHLERGLAKVLAGGPLDDKAPQQLRAALDRLRREDANAAGALGGRIDFAHVAVTGHSQGGAAVSDVLGDGGVSAGVLLASSGFGAAPAGKPLLMMGGAHDGIAKRDLLEQSFQKQPAGTRLLELKDAGHLAFTDLCVVGRDRGGVLQIALDHGIAVDALMLKLGKDGCQAGDLPAEQGFPLIDHYVTAHLRAALGIDASPKGFDSAAQNCFGDRLASSEED